MRRPPRLAHRFSEAFDRWRQLYQSAREQLHRGQPPIGDARPFRLTNAREAKTQQAQANEQIALLERGAATGGADFYTYRYLATEGFLPGYNFPRLPLYAYVPATTAGCKGAYLQRARFIAISEFGPRSLIYHEGRAYRVYKAKLPPGVRTEEGGRLPTATLYVCDECGAAHSNDEPERCHACNAPMGGVHPIRNVLRIDNVETSPAERITANDEDRQRQGFEIQTVFAWSQRDGRLDVTEAVASDADGPILALSYAPGATISRLNKGLRRRKEKSIFGFGIDPATGRWTGSPVEGDDDDDPDEPIKQRVVPIVQDHKNALLLRVPGERLSEQSMATLAACDRARARNRLPARGRRDSDRARAFPREPARHPRLRGNRRRRRRARTTDQRCRRARQCRASCSRPHALPRSRRGDRRSRSGAARRQMRTRIASRAATAACSPTYNQPDHEQIDRTDDAGAPAAVAVGPQPGCAARNLSRTPSRRAIGMRPCVRWGLPAPDAEPLTVNGTILPIAWRAHLAAAAIGAVDAETRAGAEALGYTVAVLPEAPGEQPPAELVDLLGASA